MVAHPECPEAVLRHADFIGSTSAIIEYCADSPAREFIVMTESGVNYSLERAAPGKKFPLRRERELQLQRMPVHAAQHAGETARRAAEPRTRASNSPPDLMRRALLPIERMLAVG